MSFGKFMSKCGRLGAVRNDPKGAALQAQSLR